MDNVLLTDQTHGHPALSVEGGVTLPDSREPSVNDNHKGSELQSRTKQLGGPLLTQ